MPPDNCFQLIAQISLSSKILYTFWANLSKYHENIPFMHLFDFDNCIWKYTIFDQLFLVPWYSNKSSMYQPKKKKKNVFAYLQSVNSVVWISGSYQLRCIITLENLKVPLKMSLGRSHVKLPTSSSHEWIR